MKSSLTEENSGSRLRDTEAHWNELHQPQHITLGEVLRNAGQRLKEMPVSEVVGIAAAGLALGFLFYSRGKFTHGRGHRFTKLLENSVLPAAKKGIHHAYDTLRDGKPLERMNRRVARFRNRW